MNPKNANNKRAFNKAINWLTKYNAFDTQRNMVSSDEGEDCAKWRAIDRKCANAFDKYLEACVDLPQYEVKRIETSELY